MLRYREHISIAPRGSIEVHADETLLTELLCPSQASQIYGMALRTSRNNNMLQGFAKHFCKPRTRTEAARGTAYCDGRDIFTHCIKAFLRPPKKREKMTRETIKFMGSQTRWRYLPIRSTKV